MKQKKPAPDMYLPKAEREKKKEVTMDDRFCLICTKKTEGYGPWAQGYTCSRTCELVQEAKGKDYGENDPERSRNRTG